VVTSGSTASAAEIVSGAVQDHDRGIIVGERTFGKGLVQQVARLPFETSLKLTVAKYYTPSGRCIQSVEYKEGGVGDDSSSEDGVRRDFRFGESFRCKHMRACVHTCESILCCEFCLISNRRGTEAVSWVCLLP